MKQFLLFLIIPLFLASCSESEEEWVDLLDEEHAQNWRGYNAESLPPGWTIEDDMLYFDTEMELEQDYEGGSDVIYGGKEYEHF